MVGGRRRVVVGSQRRKKEEESRVVLGVEEELFLALAVAIDLDHVISSSGQSFVPSRRTFVCIVKAFLRGRVGEGTRRLIAGDGEIKIDRDCVRRLIWLA
jgi:hypothetical protein